MEIKTKKCKGPCGLIKYYTEFHIKRARGKEYRVSWCKICSSIKRRDKYLKYREKELLQMKIYREKHAVEISEFKKQWRKENEEYVKNKKQQWYKENKEKLKIKSHNRYEKNKEEIKIKVKIYREENKDKFNKQRKTRRLQDASFRLRGIVSSVIGKTIKKNKGFKKSSVWSKLPYTPQQLREHLESQFEDWMSWNNYGVYKNGGLKTWHIDHIISQSLFPYDSLEHPNFKLCWALENLRPLEAIENIKKGNKIIYEIF